MSVTVASAPAPTADSSALRSTGAASNADDPRTVSNCAEGRLELTGDLSLDNSADLLTLFTESLDRNKGLILDLSHVEACDTAALQLLCALRQTASAHGYRLRIIALSSAIEIAAAALGLSTTEITGPRESDRGV